MRSPGAVRMDVLVIVNMCLFPSDISDKQFQSGSGRIDRLDWIGQYQPDRIQPWLYRSMAGIIIVFCLLIMSACSDEKTISREAADISIRKPIPASESRRRQTVVRGQKKKPVSVEKRQQKHQPKTRLKSAAKPVFEKKRPPKVKKKGGKAQQKTTAGPEPSVSTVSVERNRIRRLFRDSRDLFKDMVETVNNHRLGWKDLRAAIIETANMGPYTATQRRRALEWSEYLEKNSRQLVELFALPYRSLRDQDGRRLEFIREERTLLTPLQKSMWLHCRLNFKNRYPDIPIRLLSGYRSPAYQALILSSSAGSLDHVLKTMAPPGFSHHQKPVPDLTVHLPERGPRQKALANLHQVCGAFGFRKGMAAGTGEQAELSFIGHDQLYKTTLENRIIPRRLKRNFLNAMERTHFYPSPDGMRVLFALSAQESSLSWNPKLNRPKKAELRSKFHHILGTIENSLGGKLTELFFSAESNREKNLLVEELERITDPNNRRIREYDFYLWTRKVSLFLNRLLQENKRLTSFGKWFYRLEQFAEQIKYEPQTYGLWQINVNHLTERIERHPQLRRRFPEVFVKQGDGWKIDRERIIDVLSGMPGSVLDRQRALELIMHTYLQPRYQSHLLGNPDDLTYFIAENVAGEMSTFRAAIQQELNLRVGSTLALDGDLSFYEPYSTRIDWKRTSNTQQAFRRFIKQRYAYFSRPVKVETLLSTLCEADSWGKLQRSELYRRIMRKKRGKRIFPNIRSAMYNQTPQTYAKVVWQKSKLF